MVGAPATVRHDLLVVLGVAAALLAGLVVVDLGLLLPGLLARPGGRRGDGAGRRLEPGPGDPPVITEPARPQPPRIAGGAARPAPAGA